MFNLKNPILKNQKSLFRIIIFSFFSLAGIVIFYFLLLSVLFLIYKNDLSKTILLNVNQKISGKISFDDIAFTPFRYFPNASLILKNFSLSESKDSALNADKLPVFEISEVYISINIIDLLSSKINASAIDLSNGNINIIVYPDSQINLKNALGEESKKEIVQQKREPVDTVTQKIQTKTETEFAFQFDNFELTDILITAENQFKKNKIQLKVNELQSSLTYQNKVINSSFKLDCEIDSIIKNGTSLITDTQIELNSKLQINSDSIFFRLGDGTLIIDKTQFQFSGFFDSKNQGYLDLSVIGSDRDFSLFSLFLNDDGLKNLKSGEMYLNANIKGKTFVEFPSIEIAFGLNKVYLTNPLTSRPIKNLNLAGNFKSGESDDWSDAELFIDTLYADLYDGFVKLSGSINNFTQPQINVNVLLSADVTGLEKVFKLGTISDLKGKLEITDRLIGKYLVDEKKYLSEMNKAKISFSDFSITIPGKIKFDKVDGVIRRENDDIFFDDLSVISEDTDFLIKGHIKNAMAILFKNEEEIIADIRIKSKVFDLPNFLFFDPSIKRDFNHRILDAEVDVVAKTTTLKATKFKSFPEIEFDIKKIDATAEDFLPRIKINSGLFKISENILGFNLKFSDFKTNFLSGKFNFTGEYNTSKFQPFYIKANADCNDIYPSELLYTKGDSVPETLDGKLSGSFFTEVQFSTDSLILKQLKFKNSNFLYKFSKDTIRAKNFNFYLNNIYFDERSNQNPFATMFASGELQTEHIQSKSFNFNDIDLSINVNNGSYEIKSDVVRLFGENAQGSSLLKMTPFAIKPAYQLSLNNVRFNAEKLLAVFNEDSVFKGPVNLSLNLTSSGTEWNKIIDNIDGTINLSGEQIILNGLDAEEIIDKFKRSQSFNLVDLGAVLLAGPVGIAVTKGTDFARIFVFNSGKYTLIQKLVSNWTIKNGTFKIIDAAFSTTKNRIALTGSIGFADNKLDLVIALLNKSGCSIFSQNVYGNLDSPQLGKVKVVGTVLAPVTNLVDDVTGKDCVVFYQGSVEHPK